MRRSVWFGTWAFVILMTWLGCVACFGDVPRESLCTIYLRGSMASGVVIGHSKTPGKATHVLSCAHLANGNYSGAAVIAYSNGKRLKARMLAADNRCDLMAFETAQVQIPAVRIAARFLVGEKVYKGGFPAEWQGRYQRTTGVVKGPDSYCGLLISNRVTSGDSGGGVFNERNELVGIVSGFQSGASICSAPAENLAYLRRIEMQLTQCGGYYCGPQFGGYVLQGQCQPYQPQQQLQPQPYVDEPPQAEIEKPPAPQQPTPATDPCEDLRDQLAIIAAQMKTNQELLAKIESTSGRDGKDGEKGEPGPEGKQGIPGLPGKDGKDAAAPDVDSIIARIRQDIKADVTSAVAAAVANIDVQAGAPVDVDAMASAVAKIVLEQIKQKATEPGGSDGGQQIHYYDILPRR